MNIYEKIENLYQNNQEMPTWAKQIINELKEIKTELRNIDTQKKPKETTQDYYTFINEFRNTLKAYNDFYPEVIYENRRLGINFKGHLYDKETTALLPRAEAFKVYEYFYSKKDEIKKHIIAN